MNRLHDYSLRIDGPLLRSQRQWLLSLAETTLRGVVRVAEPGGPDLLEGVLELLDQIADQAHDRYGIDCLLEEPAETDGGCPCEQGGYFDSGVPGILAHLENGRLAPGAAVERCDQCQRYPTDAAARQTLVELGIAPPDAQPPAAG
jgi:hypothetical protein